MSDGRVVLIGTNHVSEDSGVAVRSAIRRHTPDVVAVELGPTRADRLTTDSHTPLRELLAIARNRGAGAAAVYLALTAVYLDADTPADGGDMTVAARTAAAHGLDVALADRDIRDTLAAVAAGVREDATDHYRDVSEEFNRRRELFARREWPALARRVLGGMASGMWPHVRLRLRLARHGVFLSEMDAEDLTPAAARVMADELDRAAPESMDALLHQRDAHLAGRLHALRRDGRDVVAVVGRAHVDGVQSYLSEPDTIPGDVVECPEELPADELETLI